MISACEVNKSTSLMLTFHEFLPAMVQYLSKKAESHLQSLNFIEFFWSYSSSNASIFVYIKTCCCNIQQNKGGVAHIELFYFFPCSKISPHTFACLSKYKNNSIHSRDTFTPSTILLKICTTFQASLNPIRYAVRLKLYKGHSLTDEAQ